IRSARPAAEPTADPFAEHRTPRYQLRLRVLGAEFQFQSEHRELLALAAQAYAGLPSQQLPGPPRRLRVRLVLGEPGRPRAGAQPPAVQPVAAGGIVGGALAG